MVLGENASFILNITIEPGYELAAATVNDVDVLLEAQAGTITIANIKNETTIDLKAKELLYYVVEGDKQVYTIDKDSEAVFKFDGPHGLFVAVYVDDVLVDPVNYTLKPGSTIVTFLKTFLDKLTVGEHQIRVEYADTAKAYATFTVAKELPVETPVETPKEETKETPKTSTKTTSTKTTTAIPVEEPVEVPTEIPVEEPKDISQEPTSKPDIVSETEDFQKKDNTAVIIISILLFISLVIGFIYYKRRNN